MVNLNDIINLAKTDGGKFFVIDEQGDPKLVIMSIEDYQRLLLGKLKKQVEDVEKINREILKVQLAETEIIQPPVKPVFKPAPSPRVDLREEVIDPSFDFEGTKLDIDDL